LQLDRTSRGASERHQRIFFSFAPKSSETSFRRARQTGVEVVTLKSISEKNWRFFAQTDASFCHEKPTFINLHLTLTCFFKEVARGGERTRGLSISFIFSFSPLYR
jgi:hypothetical protein